jgi:DNA-binding response OmpR family regulator
VADGSPTIRKVVELTFSDSRFHVESVGDGAAAMESLALLKPDLLLADVALADSDGYEICRSVKESERPVPVLLLVGAFEEFDRERARACGADGHVTKPFDSRALFDRVRELLAAAEKWGERSRKPPAGLKTEELDAIARAVLERLSLDVVREIAREVVPDVAQRVVLERIRELEEEKDN